MEVTPAKFSVVMVGCMGSTRSPPRVCMAWRGTCHRAIRSVERKQREGGSGRPSLPLLSPPPGMNE